MNGLMLGAKAVSVRAQLLDIFRCVERLSDTDPSSFRRLVQRDSLIAAVPRTDSLPAFKVDTRELLRRLPLHVMACVLAQEPRENGRHYQDSAMCCTRNPLPLHVIFVWWLKNPEPTLGAEEPRANIGLLSKLTGHDMQRHSGPACSATKRSKRKEVDGNVKTVSWSHWTGPTCCLVKPGSACSQHTLIICFIRANWEFYATLDGLVLHAAAYCDVTCGIIRWTFLQGTG